MKSTRSFASDNNAPIHPEIFDALARANANHVVAYGNDPYTERATHKLKDVLGAHAVHFVFTGTAANVLCLQAMTKPFNAVLCASTAHLNVHECGAPERLTGCKLIDIATPDGKLRVPDLEHRLHGLGDEHEVQPRVISITQCTEYGTVYTREEIKRLADFAHEHGLLLHMDGARLSNAAAHLNCSLKELTKDCDVDALSLGGTKNGIMGGEAVVFFNPGLDENFKFYRKQLMQLSSKMRYLSVQMEALFEGDLWLRNARHANAMAARLAARLKKLPRIEVTQKTEANAVFARVPPELIAPLQKEYFFYIVDHERSEARWMTSFDTSEDDVNKFASALEGLLKAQ
ncbi:MAG TPA: beta-eliminating lyase-related protein [Bdellovibrionales bacterium]|nr:beta-eliminating lyase-related protein [Bdellovibrionales bacterium]